MAQNSSLGAHHCAIRGSLIAEGKAAELCLPALRELLKMSDSVNQNCSVSDVSCCLENLHTGQIATLLDVHKSRSDGQTHRTASHRSIVHIERSNDLALTTYCKSLYSIMKLCLQAIKEPIQLTRVDVVSWLGYDLESGVLCRWRSERSHAYGRNISA